MKKYSVTPATKEQIEEIQGDVLKTSVQAFVVKCEDDPIGIIGVHNHQTALILFSYIKPKIQRNLKKYRRGVIKGYRKMMSVLKKRDIPVFSHADEDVDGSDRLLKHIGFEEYSGRWYKWHG